MDPTTSLIVTAVVGGAAGRFIEQITSNGMQWLLGMRSGNYGLRDLVYF